MQLEQAFGQHEAVLMRHRLLCTGRFKVRQGTRIVSLPVEQIAQVVVGRMKMLVARECGFVGGNCGIQMPQCLEGYAAIGMRPRIFWRQ